VADVKPPRTGGELGSVLSWADSLFVDYLDPSMGSVAWWEARDYANMLRTESQARKVEQVLTLPILAAPQAIRPGKGDKGECEWITEQLTRPANAGGMSTPLRTVVAQATSAITYRVASFEKVWKETDRPGSASGIGFTYDKLAFRPAVNTRVRRDRKTGAYRGLEQDPPYGGEKPVRIDPELSFTHVHGQHRSPILGSSDMEIPLICWKAKQKLRFLWFLFLELHAQPRVSFSDARENAGDHNNTKDAARKFTQLRGGGAIALPPGVTGNVLETGGHAADLYQAALKYLDGEMTGQVLAQFADLAGAAASGTGSFALSRDQSDFFMQSRRWAAMELEDTMSNYVLADLVRHNYGPDAACPTFHIGPLVAPDLEALTPMLAQVGTALPADFVAFIVESTATALNMPADRVAQLVKATTDAHEKAAQTARQAELAKATGPIAAAERIVRKAATQDGEARGRAAAAAAAAGQ
jgi:hypothetical protein